MSNLHAVNLLQEHPWIIDIVGKKSFEDAKVQRLDGSHLQQYGRTGYDGNADNRWYLINRDGLLLNEAGIKKPETFLEKVFPFLCCWFAHDETVFAAILRTMKEAPEEEIMYVLEDRSGSCLTLYKVPKGHTMETFITEVQEAITAEIKCKE